MAVHPTDDTEMQHVASTFDPRLEDVRAAPADEGIVELIVRRPAEGDRELLAEARIDEDLGLIGDRWATRDVARTPAYLSAQLTLISTRVLAIIEPDQARWALAGDQLYVDFDLSEANFPPRVESPSARRSSKSAKRRTLVAPSSAPGSGATPCAGSTRRSAGPIACAA